jgi:hypothetical protein
MLRLLETSFMLQTQSLTFNLMDVQPKPFVKSKKLGFPQSVAVRGLLALVNMSKRGALIVAIMNKSGAWYFFSQANGL